MHKILEHSVHLRRSRTIGLSVDDVRPLTLKDVEDIEKLVSPTTKSLFGDVDVFSIVYNSYLTLGTFNIYGKLVGAISLNDFPNMLTIPPWSWMPWVQELYDLYTVNGDNTMWMHLLVWNPKFTRVYLKPLLQVLFKTHRLLEFVVLAIPSGFNMINFLTDTVTRLLPLNHGNPATVTTLGLLSRQNFVVRYKIRKAVEEDSDDIVKMVARHAPDIEKMYDKYWMAEILTRIPNSTRQIIVAEYGGYAVAAIVLNSIINREIMVENFELIPFHGLKTPDKNDSIGLSFMTSYSRMYVDVSELKESRLNLQRPHKMDKVRTKPVNSDVVASDSDSTILCSGSFDSGITISSDVLAFLGKRVPSDFSGQASLESYSKREITFTSNLMLSCPHKNVWDQLRRKSKLIEEQEKPKPVFHGKRNAFSVEIIAAKEDHEQAIDLLLQSCFDCFPTRNYCCLTSPSTTPTTGFLNNFIKVSPTPDSTFSHELFIMHRNSVQLTTQVRIAVKEDTPFVKEFLDNMLDPGNVMEQFEFTVREGVENSGDFAFVMIAQFQVIGLAILSERIDLNFILSHYSMYKWLHENRQKPGSICILENMLIYPVFQNHCTLFLSQIHRYSDYSAIFYIITPEDSFANRERPLNNALHAFIPIKPRDVQEYDEKVLEHDCMPAEAVTRKGSPFQLYLSMRRLMSIKRIEMNDKIVVVGAGYTANGFFEALICTPTPELITTFSNVVVVAPHDLSHYQLPNEARDAFFIYRGRFSHQYVQQTSLQSELNIVCGVLTRIDRNKKRIFLQSGKYLSYDILVLLAGEQFQFPKPRKINRLEDDDIDNYPPNVCIINSERDATDALNSLNDFINGPRSLPNGKVIVYGHTLKAHCAISGLLIYGVPAKSIVYVHPAGGAKLNGTNPLLGSHQLLYSDPDVELMMFKAIKQEGVTIYPGVIIDYQQNPDSGYVTQVNFASDYYTWNIPCNCMFFYSTKSTSPQTLDAILESNLVYDGRLVIDAKFRTNDPHIYAAGPITKYSRRYCADHKSHRYYNSEEVGNALGAYIKSMLLAKQNIKHIVRRKDKYLSDYEKQFTVLPLFVQPVVKSCYLPGRIHYLHVSKPGMEDPCELQITKDNFGKIYVTGDIDNLDRQGYFRIHVNRYKNIETITCLSKNKIPINNILNLWGKHVKLLNNMSLRFEIMAIPDFFEFFREPWCCALYYDRFEDILIQLKQIFYTVELSEGKTLVDMIMQCYQEKKWNKLDISQKKKMKKIFNHSGLRTTLEEIVMNFVEENTAQLPMYAHPNLIQAILQDFQKSPLFTE